MAKFPLKNHRILMFDNREIEFSGDLAAISLSDTVFGFLDEGFEGSSPDSIGEENINDVNQEEEEDDDDADEGEKQNIANVNDVGFWETQHQLLEATLCRTTSMETKIRNATKNILKEAQESENPCVCRKPVVAGNGCRNCRMNMVCGRLQIDGFNATHCKSKWRSSTDIPSGEHTFLEVVDNSNPKKGDVRIIIELNLRGEFEMARANEEYNRLVKRLPEVYIGKIERLLSIIKILCSAAKKCMKEKKMHMGPWRKHRYMQAKWLRTSTPTSSSPTSPPTGNLSQLARPRGSMLTVDLLENLPNLLFKAVAVV